MLVLTGSVLITRLAFVLTRLVLKTLLALVFMRVMLKTLQAFMLRWFMLKTWIALMLPRCMQAGHSDKCNEPSLCRRYNPACPAMSNQPSHVAHAPLKLLRACCAGTMAMGSSTGNSSGPKRRQIHSRSR